jgi:hypothetical protein
MPPVVRPVSPVRSCWREPTRSGFSASSWEWAKPSKSWSSSSVRSVMTTSVGFLSCGYSATAWAYSSPSPWTCLGPGRGGEEPQRAGRAWCRPHPRAERQAAHQGAGPASGGSGVRPRARPARPAAHCRAVAQDRGAGRQRADRLCGGRHGDGAHRRSYGAAEHYRRDQADGKRKYSRTRCPSRGTTPRPPPPSAGRSTRRSPRSASSATVARRGACQGLPDTLTGNADGPPPQQ